MGYFSALDADLTNGWHETTDVISPEDSPLQDELITDCEMIRETLLALLHENYDSRTNSYGVLGRIFQTDILIKKRKRSLEEHNPYNQLSLFDLSNVFLN